MKNFRFYIYLNDDQDNLREVFPNYKDDVAIETELETGQKFYRDKFSGKISFLNKPTKDFDFIMSQVFDTQYNLVIEYTQDYGQTWNREFVGKFFQTDCDIDEDSQKIETQLDTVDDYIEVLAGLEKEYNLADLPIEIKEIYLQKRPMIQIYIPGDEIVSCFLSGMTWEQDVTESTTDITKLTSTYKFSFSTVIRNMTIESFGSPADVAGVYSNKTTNANPFIGVLNSVNGYRIEVSSQFNGPPLNQWITGAIIYRNADNQPMYFAMIQGINGLTDQKFVMNPYDGISTGNVLATFETKPIYARYVLDVGSINGVPTYPIPADDLVENNRNYSRVIGYAIDVVRTSTRMSDEPTKWGKNSAGQYYLPPYSLTLDKFFPIAQSLWDNASYWFVFSAFDSILEAKGRSSVVLRDSYPLSSVISSLLKEFAPEITHEATEEYSQFLYGSMNPIAGQAFRLFISQKTNVLNLQYQNPAQNTIMTLQSIFNMLRDCFRVFWYIDENKLKFEHVEWFRNGGSYIDNAGVSYDLTQYINPKNLKDWGFASNKYSYDKVDMAERFQFKWMDDVSTLFQGFPIEMLSKYVQRGKVDDMNISNFNSDIDYLLLNPDDISKDGFLLMAAVERSGFIPLGYGGYEFYANNSGSNTFDIKPTFQGETAQIKLTAQTLSGTGITYILFLNSSGTAIPGPAYTFTPDGTQKTLNVVVPNGTVKMGVYSERNISGNFDSFIVVGDYELPFIQQYVDGYDSDLQNGIVAMTYLQPRFHVYDLPAKHVKINQEEMIVETDRKKKQQVEFPVKEKINPLQLINTSIGYGQIDKVSLNLHSRSAKTTLKYDTE